MAQKDCKLCNYFKNCFQSYQILTRALYNKYSQSQNFFYGKITEKFIQSESNKNIINFKDQIFYDDDEEYFKKVYHFPHLKKKKKDLIEYYKYHTEIPRVYMLPISLVCNYFHDKKRRINYYKIKLLLHQQNGNQEQLQVTPSSISSSEYSSDPSNSQFAMTKFLNPHLLQSFNFIKEKPTQKDTIIEMNGILQNLSKLNLKDVEQYSYFLMDTQISDQSISFKQGFQDKLIKIKQFFSHLQQQKAPKIKFKQKPVQSQQQEPPKQLQPNKQLTKQKSIQNLIQNNQLAKNTNNLQNIAIQSTRNQYDQKKKKQNNFRTQSEMNVNTLFTPNKKEIIEFNQKKQNLNRPQSNEKKTNNLVKQYKKQSLDFKNLKQKDNLISPQNNIIVQNKEQTKNLFRNRQKNPQSMQITNEFLIKVNKQYEGDKLNAIIQKFKDKQNHKSQEKYKNLQLKIKKI